MSHTCEGPAPARTGPAESTPARKPLDVQDSDPGALEATAGEILRRLSRDIIEASSHVDPRQRLQTAAAEGARLVADGQLNRTAMATVMSVPGQAAGIGQADALAIIRGAFRQAGVR